MDQYEVFSEDLTIRYQIHGNGPQVILFIHGAVGSLNDFALQFDQEYGLDLNQFKLVLFDLPGFGLSKLHNDNIEKPKDVPTMEYFECCAKYGAQLMSRLHFKTYSVAAWSDGARVACLIAIDNPSRVNSLLLWSFSPTNHAKSTWALARTRDINTWDKDALRFYTDVYGDQDFSDRWRRYVDWLVAALENSDQFDIRHNLNKIKCPTLILHGSVDPIVQFDEVAPLERVIYNSSVDQIKGLSHNLHQADSYQFNQVLTNFVLGTGVSY